MDSKTGMMSIRTMRERLLGKASDDDAFRARLLDDPKGAVHDELGVELPAGFTVKVHEETADTTHLVLPPPARLDEAELIRASGGVDWNALYYSRVKV